MDYIQYKVNCAQELTDILIALFGEYPFDTFEEDESGMSAYIPAQEEDEATKNAIQVLQQQFDFQYERIFVPAQNWNEVWESNFEPIVVDNFCGLRAEFHPPISHVKHELLIQPKMAFGTGHHATTYQMIQQMQFIDFTDKRVLDYGCGTGVLAMLAAKEGAGFVEAIDIDEWAYENTLENININNSAAVHVVQGDLALVKDKTYDVVLANITFNVISTSLEALSLMIPSGGWLLTSGFYLGHGKMLMLQATDYGFQAVRESQRNDWACVVFQKQ
jgi:ribosomal protein L11 methyltransferase